MIPDTCTKCDICLINKYHPSKGDGNIDANIMFITSNPSTFEAKIDIPLTSKDGLLFQEYLDLFNFHRDDIYITNAVKCRTPNHRLPTDREIYNCREYLDIEVAKVNPRIIVLLGDTAIRSYFKLAFTTLNLSIDSLNAKYISYEGRVIVFMIHPAHGVTSINVRTDIYNAFLTLLRLYKIINPAHTTNIIGV